MISLLGEGSQIPSQQAGAGLWPWQDQATETDLSPPCTHSPRMQGLPLACMGASSLCEHGPPSTHVPKHAPSTSMPHPSAHAYECSPPFQEHTPPLRTCMRVPPVDPTPQPVHGSEKVGDHMSFIVLLVSKKHSWLFRV